MIPFFHEISVISYMRNGFLKCAHLISSLSVFRVLLDLLELLDVSFDVFILICLLIQHVADAVEPPIFT